MRTEYANVAAIPAGAWKWPHVSPAKEWACKGTGKILVDTEFLDLFEKLRVMYGRPLIINSGYRSPEYNARISSTGTTGPHTTARAMDIRIYGTHAFELVALAIGLGFTGVGVKQVGALESRFVHIDQLDPASYPRPNLWSYADGQS